MKKVQILIIEDQPRFVAAIKEWIAYFCRKNNFDLPNIYDCDSIVQGEKILKEHPINIIVLDYWVFGEDYSLVAGTKLIDQNSSLIKEKEVKVIVISSEWEKVAARLQYPGIIYAGIDRIESKFHEALQFVYQDIQKDLALKKEYTSIRLPLKEVSLKKSFAHYQDTEFSVDNILYLESSKNVTYLYRIEIDDIAQYVTSYNLNKVLSLLPSKQFVRVHKSFAVNAERINAENLDLIGNVIVFVIKIERKIKIPLGGESFAPAINYLKNLNGLH